MNPRFKYKGPYDRSVVIKVIEVFAEKEVQIFVEYPQTNPYDPDLCNIVVKSLIKKEDK